MEMVPNLPLSRSSIEGPYSKLWRQIFDPENVKAERVWKLTLADCTGKSSLKNMATAAQSAGRTRNVRVITRQTHEGLFIKVLSDKSQHYFEETK